MAGVDIPAIRRQLARYLTRFVRRHEDIEDLVQETLAKVLESSTARGIGDSRRYAFRTAHNLALNAVTRKSAQMTEYLDEALELGDEGGTSVEAQAIVREDFERLCQVIARLPTQCRTVLVLRKVYGLSQNEVAERLGIATSTVEKHLAKAIARCAADLEGPAAGSIATLSRLQAHE